MQKHMRLPTTDRPPLTQVKLSRRSCCWLSYSMAEEMPAELEGRMDPSQYADLTLRLGASLGPASRGRLCSLLFFLGLVAVFAVVLAGQHLHFTRYHYYGLLGLAVFLWCTTLLVTIISLLYLRKVSVALAELSYDCQRMGLSLRMVWWPWAIYADLHPVTASVAATQHQPTTFNVQDMVTAHHQPFPLFIAAPPHVMTAGMAPQTPQQPMYYFVPQQLQQPQPMQ